MPRYLLGLLCDAPDVPEANEEDSVSDPSALRRGNRREQPIQAIVLTAVLAVGIWLGVALVHAYDPRLDEALAALQKAAALVEESSAGVVTPHIQHKFDNARDKALASIEDAMEHIVAAGIAADSDGGAH